MKVSVLITTYNLEKYIEETLESVMCQQTSFDYEVLVGDDGSSDNTVEIINRYISKYPGKISLYQMPREEGVDYNRVERSAANRINLLEHAHGEYISFLDGDDYYTSPNRLSRMVNLLDEEENADCIMCAHNLVMHFDDHDGGALCSAKKTHKWAIKDYWPQIFIQANALLFRNIYKKVEIKDTLKACAPLLNNFDDNNITFWLFKYGKMLYIPDCLGAYRQVSGSSWNGIDELKKHCSNMIGYSIECELNPGQMKYILARHYKDFEHIKNNIDSLSRENCNPFYDTAEKYHLDKALEIYNLCGASEEQQKAFGKMVSKAKKYMYAYKRKRGIKKLLRCY